MNTSSCKKCNYSPLAKDAIACPKCGSGDPHERANIELVHSLIAVGFIIALIVFMGVKLDLFGTISDAFKSVSD